MQEKTENTQQVLIEPERMLPDFTFEQLPSAMRDPLVAMGWRTPMPVQAKAIPYLMDNRDMIVQSRTGSGKTGAFLMPLLMRIDTSKRYPQALVLVPTRELAMQVFKELETLSQGMPVSSSLLYGGVGYGVQLQALRDGAQVIIGTPGRVLDHIGRRSLNLDRLSIIVFDEADEMLSMGFYPDMRELRRYLPRQRSSWMFSATMPYKVQMLAREFLNEPEFLSLSAGNIGVSTMEHRCYDVPPLEKDLMLMRLIEFEHPESAIVFCNTKVDVEYLTTVLRNYGYHVEQLSGDLDQKSRERAMESIRRGETRFLVATDVAARGIDISDLSHVFQYDVPKDPDSYIHRAGRTARAGNTGVVVTLVANMSERSDLKKIARKFDIDFVEMPMPTQEELDFRMAERTVVILEDRQRALPRLSRERMKRFSGFVQTLAENEEERLLLAMLIDEIYQSAYHQPAPTGQAVEAPSHSGGPQQAPAHHGQSQHQQRPPQQRSAPAAAAPASDRPAGVGDAAEGGEGERRKKKRRRKKKNRGGQGEAQLDASGNVQAPQQPSDRPRDERPRDDRPREERPRDERPRDDRPREERPRDERPRDERPRDERPREERPRDERPRDERPRDERPRDERPNQSRGGNRDRRDRPAQPALDFDAAEAPWVESIEVIEPDAPVPAPNQPDAKPAGGTATSDIAETPEAVTPADTIPEAGPSAKPKRAQRKKDEAGSAPEAKPKRSSAAKSVDSAAAGPVEAEAPKAKRAARAAKEPTATEGAAEAPKAKRATKKSAGDEAAESAPPRKRSGKA